VLPNLGNRRVKDVTAAENGDVHKLPSDVQTDIGNFNGLAAEGSTSMPFTAQTPAKPVNVFDYFDTEGARSAGYTDKDMADWLAGQHGFDISNARNSRYSDKEIVRFLSQLKPAASNRGALPPGYVLDQPPAAKESGPWDDYAPSQTKADPYAASSSPVPQSKAPNPFDQFDAPTGSALPSGYQLDKPQSGPWDDYRSFSSPVGQAPTYDAGDYRHMTDDQLKAIAAAGGDPSTYVRVFASLQPKEVEIGERSPLEDMPDGELYAMGELFGKLAEAKIPESEIGAMVQLYQRARGKAAGGKV
jgi:hypothetical protein